MEINFSNYQNIIIVSPHIDDAFYSLGGFISKYNKLINITVINVFSRSNFVYGELNNVEYATNIRQKEDSRLYSRFNIPIINLEFGDAPLRGYELDLLFSFKSISLGDNLLLKEIELKLTEIISSLENKLFLFPLGFGNHIDHVLVNMLSKNIDSDILYYEDLPYVNRIKNNTYGLKNTLKKRPLEIKLSEKDYSSHINGLSVYKSQITSKHLIEISSYLKKLKIILWI